MNEWQALLLGLVEGITEYLPVSSTGHLLLTQRLLGIPQTEAADAFAICIQAGAILAVLGLYRARVGQAVAGITRNDPAGKRLIANLLAGLIPALALGFILEKTIKKFLFGGETLGLWPIIAAWAVGGVAILAVSAFRKRRAAADRPRLDLDAMTWRHALVIGLCQCIAMWPGTSRSLVTIVAGILVGLRMHAAVEFSFLLGVLTLSAATAYDALKHGADLLAAYGPIPLAIGFAAAWISALLAVKWMVAYLTRNGLEIFGWYRLAIAGATAALVLAGIVR
jgi:undecaprenyl-diphosphatase